MFGKFFDSLFNKHKFIRRIIVLWFMWLASWTAYKVVPKLEGSHAVSALAIIIGIFSVITGFYMYLRDKDGD